MAQSLNHETVQLVKELTKQITKLEENSEKFKHYEKRIIDKLTKADSMYFLNRQEVDKQINNMSEKFIFHGFIKQADNLKKSYNNYLKTIKSNETIQLNIVKFLLCMSDSPTTNFWKYPEKFIVKEEEEEIINWGEYLNEGIDFWSPDNNTDSDTESATTNSSNQSFIAPASSKQQIWMDKPTKLLNLRDKRNELLENIQHTWFNGQTICMQPASEWKEANEGIIWEEFLKEQVKGIIDIGDVTVISEYKVMREIIWQLYGLHDSVVFQFVETKLVIRDNVTIASIRSNAFKGFLEEFLIYMNTLHELRQFFKSTESKDFNDNFCPITYKNYSHSVMKILEQVNQEIIEIEEIIRRQETTMTLLILSERLKQICEPILILNRIHKSLKIENFHSNSNLNCTIILLKNLHKSLKISLNQIEHNIKMTLYIESLSYYLNLINNWFVKNIFIDKTNEFIILKRPLIVGDDDSSSAPLELSEDWQLNFMVHDKIEEVCENDGILKMITGPVLQIGRNIHLLRLLKNFEQITTSNETIYEQFVKRILKEMKSYYKTINEIEEATEKIGINSIHTFSCQNLVQDLVDTRDGFLMKAFEKYFKQPTINDETKIDKNLLYEKICNITKGKSLFPINYFFETILNDILKENFIKSGLMMKNLLIVNYKLDKQLKFLRDLFLFNDNMLYPFYQYLFNKMLKLKNNWGNSVWLTGNLHDVINDIYPSFYVNCKIQTKTNWLQCENSLECCEFINLQYDVDWPINIIITTNHLIVYKELFQCLLKLKWALFMLKNLIIKDLSKKWKKMNNKFQNSLQCLRFALLNLTNNIQHFIFGYIIPKYLIEFELNFEKANNIEELMYSHSNFINSIYRNVRQVVNCKGYQGFLTCVLMLHKLWTGEVNLSFSNIKECYDLYRSSYKNIEPVINSNLIFET